MYPHSYIIANLRREIASLQSHRLPGTRAQPANLNVFAHAFPQNEFPLGCIHECIAGNAEQEAATTGFISGIASALIRDKGAAVWITSNAPVFPPALKAYGIAAERILFLELPGAKQALWVMEEALKCAALSIVIGEVNKFDFTASRRLQLATEASKVTGIVIRKAKQATPTVAAARWQVTSLHSSGEEGLPGPGYPRWNIKLLKVKNGQPSEWNMEWVRKRFRIIEENSIEIEQRKVS